MLKYGFTAEIEEKKDENTMAILSKKEISKLTPSELEKFALEQAKKMALNLENTQEEINMAKDLARRAKNHDTSGFFGFGTSKSKLNQKTNLMAEAQQQTNEALVQMNNIVQECIRFNCMSLIFAKQMNQALALIISKGLKISNENTKSLSDETNTAIETIIESTSSFIEQQESIKKDLQSLDKNINVNSQNIEKLESKFEEKDKIDSKQEEKISINIKNIEKLKNDFEKKNKLDDKQETNINTNATNIEKLNAEIMELKNKKSNVKLIFLFNTITLIISILSLILHFIKF